MSPHCIRKVINSKINGFFCLENLELEQRAIKVQNKAQDYDQGSRQKRGLKVQDGIQGLLLEQNTGVMVQNTGIRFRFKIKYKVKFRIEKLGLRMEHKDQGSGQINWV